MTDFAALRGRLLELRSDTLHRLAEADDIVPAWLALIAGVNAALLALDAEAEPLDAAAVAERVVMAGSGKGGVSAYPSAGEREPRTGSSRDFTMKPDHKSFFGK